MRFAPPGDRVDLKTDAIEVLQLAERLWEAAPEEGCPRPPITIRVRLSPDERPPRPLSDAPEWRSEREGRLWTATLGAEATVRIDVWAAAVDAEVSEPLLRDAPALAARLTLEAPVALLLCHRGFQPLHAGAVAGPKGALVLRGAQGAGKSTLVGAAWRAGLAVLGDESVLVSRDDPDALASSVRELTLREDASRLLGLDGVTTPARVGGETKRRVDLFAGSRPKDRRARRIGTVLLGPREPGPARLVPLDPDGFLALFRQGTIPQERLGDADPDHPARAWAASGLLLTGASDLSGAVALLTGAVT